MPVVKGGVWTNLEDEILKAAVSKYGLNQWARVSSLLARKTPKQCKARWSEWLDPGIRKIEWSKEEDEKLLHLAKLMPTQWRTIAPIVGRTATQCLERYQKLLDEAEARENDELGLGGPDGGETAAPSADDVRRLRPGELDPDPESKPAKPDTVDMDEDEKEMLSEARARLANTQGKKAKRKARERQLEESRRLAVLQKRRELKNAGINIKVVTRKKGQMDYNADIPFEKAPAPGFYDTQEEETANERQREQFDPRKQQLANKRKADGEQDGDEHKKKKKGGDPTGQYAASAAAARAGQMQKMREAERSSKRRALNLPSPQVSERELEDIVKMGMLGERASQSAGASDNDATRGLIGTYASDMVGATPIRTPRAPQEEDRIANEIRNARARTETQSALLGGENADLYEGDGTTGYTGVAPTKQAIATPNPLATPFRGGPAAGQVSGPGATPLRTPRDSLRLNDQTPLSVQQVGQTPREIRLQESALRSGLRSKLSSLPKPKETEWEFELPEEQAESSSTTGTNTSLPEDSSIRDQRALEHQKALEHADLQRQTQVIQRALPRPSQVDLPSLLAHAATITDAAQRAIGEEAARLIAHDAQRFGGAQIHAATSAAHTPKSSRKGTPSTLPPLPTLSDAALQHAKMEVALEVSQGTPSQSETTWALQEYWASRKPSLVPYGIFDDDDNEPSAEQMATEQALLSSALSTIQTDLTSRAGSALAIEKKLAVHLGGYQARSKALRGAVVQKSATLEDVRGELNRARDLLVLEGGAVAARLERLREEVQGVLGRERVAQGEYAAVRDELQAFERANGVVNGWH